MGLYFIDEQGQLMLASMKRRADWLPVRENEVDDTCNHCSLSIVSDANINGKDGRRRAPVNAVLAIS